ncbi:hypothetical protein P691DRAFT_663021 [Macrolepiota fuliginosa MF-IS2]|uniref:Uncharacterized protein n=1 Tax=Macrolepiota fuliginosa MF-IS2 TaxID=1400762 RepID=A0A9P5XJF0_9AGAR|nr:hypothetical protein P691DRAFT_663021 [Macrolepiota fuliginosa MF-IS2]
MYRCDGRLFRRRRVWSLLLSDRVTLVFHTYEVGDWKASLHQTIPIYRLSIGRSYKKFTCGRLGVSYLRLPPVLPLEAGRIIFMTTAPPAKPIVVQYGDRLMAIGRRHLSGMSGRAAFEYVKSRFGVSNQISAIYMDTSFVYRESEFVEIDMDTWEELVPHIYRMRLVHGVPTR